MNGVSKSKFFAWLARFENGFDSEKSFIIDKLN